MRRRIITDVQQARKKCAEGGVIAFAYIDYIAKGNYSLSEIKATFGSWSSLLEEAGIPKSALLKSTYRPTPTRAQLIWDIQRVALLGGESTYTKAQYNRGGIYTEYAVLAEFHNWGNAKAEAGITHSPRAQSAAPASRETLLEDAKVVQASLGAVRLTMPAYDRNGLYSSFQLRAAFGSWPKVLAALAKEGKQ